MNRRVIFKIITLFVLPLLAVIMAELFLLVIGYRTTYEQEDPFLGFQTVYPLFEKKSPADSTGETVYVTRQSKLKWFNYQKFRAEKPVNGYRIFCFGGSTTFGRPYFFKTAYSNWLQVILQDLMPQKYVEVINVGGVSYASYRIVNLMKEMINYSPDVFIVYTGHNEFLEDRTYAQILDAPKLVTKLRTALNHLRTYSLVRNKWMGFKGRKEEQAKKKFQMTGEVKPILDQTFGLDRYQRNFIQEQGVLNHFRVNLGRMIKIAKDNNIEIVFVVPPANKKDFSPFKSQLTQDINSSDTQNWQKLYQAGRNSLKNGDYENALQALNQAVKIDSSHADLRFRLGKCLFALSNYTKADYEFVQAKDLDIAPLRATTAIQQIVRNDCQKQSIPVIDLVEILEKQCMVRFGHSILGKEFFLDHAHPTIAVHQHLAEELTKILIQHRFIEPKKNWQDVNRQVLYDSVMATIDSVYHAMRDLNLAKVLDWAGKYEEAVPHIKQAAKALPDHPEAHYLRGLVYQNEGNFEQARKEYQQAITIDSTYTKAYNALGSIYEKTNNLEKAVECFEAAIRYQPEFDQAYYNLGNTVYRQGRIQDAINAYQQTLQLNPDHSKAMNNLGVIYMLGGNFDQAIHAFEGTLNLDPLNIKAYGNLGVIYIQKADYNKAREFLKKALEIAPDDDFSLQWLKQLENQQND